MPVQLKDADIRPISDLRNRFAEVSDYVQSGKTIIFTKNGYGCMVTMSFDAYRALSDGILSMDRTIADQQATIASHYLDLALARGFLSSEEPRELSSSLT